MTAIIIEDEIPAAIRLEKLLSLKGFQVLVTLKSVKVALHWLNNNNQPDIIFSDIKLRDGDCFEILNKIKINSKIVFTTAFNEFAIDAFKYNSIDYLLKPLDESKLDKLILKIETLKLGFQNQFNLKNFDSNFHQNFKTSFLVSVRNSLKKIESYQIVCFYSDTNNTYILTKENETFIENSSLKKLENTLNLDLFFRVNRKFIINKDYILSINNSSKIINLSQQIQFEIAISKSKYKQFLEWFKK